MAQPLGTVTLLFTDVEGSTRLLARLGAEEYGKALETHRDVLRSAFARHGGYEVSCEGDSFFFGFASAGEAVSAAIDAQLALHAATWPSGDSLRVRIGVHTGEPHVVPPQYIGLDVHRAARVMQAAHGGQILLSRTTRELLDGVETRALGAHRLKDLLEPVELHQVVAHGLPATFPPPRGARGRQLTNLPAEVDSFVGRSSEIERVLELVSGSARLVTLTGAGGSGKTRLALRAAATFEDDMFEDGVYFVDLAPLARPGLVLSAIAHAVGIPDLGIPLMEALKARFAQRRILFVLDNFEHVLADALEVATLLSACADLHVVATSRTPLRLRGEIVLDVDPLDETAAAQLFVDRAAAAGADAASLRDAGDVVAAICARVDRLPLAIELAAAQARELGPQDLLQRLGQSLDVLTEGAADMPERQRTLRAAIAWGYDLLAPRDRQLIRKLAVFRGGFTLASAEAVCDFGPDTHEALGRLVEQRLVRPVAEIAGEPRFGLLETVREFAREQAELEGEFDDVGRSFAAYFASLAEQLGPVLRRPEPEVAPAFARLTGELDNFRALYSWSADHDEADPSLRVLAATWLWSWTWLGETMETTERMLALPSAAVSGARSGALFTATVLSWALGDLERVERYALDCIAASETAHDEAGRGLALALLMSTRVDDGEAGAALYAHAQEAAAASGDGWTAAFVDVCFGLYSSLRADGAAALAAGRKAAAHFAALGATRHALLAQVPIGFGLLHSGDLEGARAVLESAAEDLTRIENTKMAALAAIGAAAAARFAGDSDAARNLYEQARMICDEAGDPSNLPVCLEGIAATTIEDDPIAAARILGTAAAAFDRGRVPTVPGYEAFAETTRGVLEAMLGDAFDAAYAQGRSGRMPEASAR